MTDGLGDMTKSDEYRLFIKKISNFKYSDDIMAKIKAHNPAYAKVATSGTWDKVFGRAIKQGEKPFRVEIAKNQTHNLFDISQTTGKQLPVLYQNISGKVEHYPQILDCLTKLSPMEIVFQSGAGYYSGIGQDSFTQDGKIVLRPALSEQQTVFALIREIIRHNQASPVAVEAASYLVCRHLNIDTANFTFGYLLEITGFDESLGAIRDRLQQDAITKEVEIFIGYLNANLPFLQGGGESESEAEPGNNTSGTAENETEVKAIELLGEISKQSKQSEQNKNESAESTPVISVEPIAATANKTEQSRSVKVHTENVNDIEFRFLEIVREFRSTLPDSTINLQAVTEYGYYDIKMHPIGANVAARLLSNGREIYKLHKDSSEERIFSTDEIRKHRGFFGISRDEWAIVQEQMLKDGIRGVTGGIDRWSRVVSPDAVEEAKKRKLAKEKMEAQKAAKAQEQAQTAMQTATQETAQTVTHEPAQTATKGNQAEDDELLIFTVNGELVLVEEDLAYNKIENHVWLESALRQFFEQTGYKPINMPYFVNKQGFAITGEMKKINSLVSGYCADLITRALEHKSIKKKNPQNGKTSYNVQKAVSIVCQSYSARHITHALNEFWPSIKAPKSIKRAFDECFDKMKKTLAAKPRRETPDESMRRVKTADEIKSGGNAAENTNASKAEPGRIASNERNAEVYHIIDSYNKHKPPKPIKPADEANGLQILPPMPTAK